MCALMVPVLFVSAACLPKSVGRRMGHRLRMVPFLLLGDQGFSCEGSRREGDDKETKRGTFLSRVYANAQTREAALGCSLPAARHSLFEMFWRRWRLIAAEEEGHARILQRRTLCFFAVPRCRLRLCSFRTPVTLTLV